MTLEDQSLDVFRNYDSALRDMEGAHTTRRPSFPVGLCLMSKDASSPLGALFFVLDCHGTEVQPESPSADVFA